MHQQWNQTVQFSACGNFQNNCCFGAPDEWEPVMGNTASWHTPCAPGREPSPVSFYSPNRPLTYVDYERQHNNADGGVVAEQFTQQLDPTNSDNTRFYNKLDKKNEKHYGSRREGRSILEGQNGTAPEITGPFNNFGQYNWCSSQFHREGNAFLNQIQFPAPINSLLADVSANSQLHQNYYNGLSSVGEDANDSFYSNNTSNSSLIGDNLTSDQDRKSLWSNIETVDGDRGQVNQDVKYSLHKILSARVAENIPVTFSAVKPSYVSVIRHTDFLTDYEDLNKPTVLKETVWCDVPCPEPMDCNNNSKDKPEEFFKNHNQKKTAVLPLKGKIGNLNYLLHFQNSGFFRKLNNLNINKNSSSCYNHKIEKKDNAFPSVLSFPFHTFQISIDMYFLFLKISTHSHIAFKDMQSCFAFIRVLSNLSHFLFEQKTKSVKDGKLGLAGKLEDECVGSGICYNLPDEQFHKSRELLIKKDGLYFRKSQRNTFLPLKICEISPMMSTTLKVDKIKILETLYVNNNCNIPVALIKQQIFSICSNDKVQEILLEIIHNLKSYFFPENSLVDRVMHKKMVGNELQSREGEADPVYQNRENIEEQPGQKIGMYIVKPISLRRALSAKIKNLFSVRPTWVDSDLKLIFEKLNVDSENFNHNAKQGIFEIKPIIFCIENTTSVKDKPYKVKYLMPNENMKVLFIKEQTTTANKTSKNKVDTISNHSHRLAKEFDDLSDNDKKNTLLLMKNNNGYENVGQEPIQIILEKLQIQGYPFLIPDTIENSPEPSKARVYLSNKMKTRQVTNVEPLTNICLDIHTVLNSSESFSLSDTCRNLAKTFIKHGVTEKQKFGCMRKVFSDAELEDLLKVMCEKGNSFLNVYEAIRKYLNLNFKGKGEFINCMAFRQARGVRSVLAQRNASRSDDNLFFFYDVLMLDGQSHLSLQVVINRKLPNKLRSVISARTHQNSSKGNSLIGQLKTIHRERCYHNLSTKHRPGVDFLCHGMEEKQVDYFKVGSFSDIKVCKEGLIENELTAQAPLNPGFTNSIIKSGENKSKDNPDVIKSQEIELFPSSTIQNDDRTNCYLSGMKKCIQNEQNIKQHSPASTWHLQLIEKLPVDLSNFSQAKLAHPVLQGRCCSPPPKKQRNSHDTENLKLLKTLSIQQYIKQNPLKDTESVESNYSSTNKSLSKSDFVHSSTHTSKQSVKLDKIKVYNKNEQSKQYQYSPTSQDKKIFNSACCCVQSCGFCTQHQQSSYHTLQCPSFEMQNSHPNGRKRRCIESHSSKISLGRRSLRCNESMSPQNDSRICRYCDKSFNQHSFKSGLFKCPKITKSSTKMCKQVWKKSYNVPTVSSYHALVKQNNCRAYTDCIVKDHNDIRMYTDPECFANIVASNLTREDEDALQRIVSEGDIFLYSPEKRRVSKDPRFRKRTIVINSLESHDTKKAITPITKKLSTKSTGTFATECDIMAFMKHCGINSIDPSLKTKNSMEFNEKCLNFLETQAHFCAKTDNSFNPPTNSSKTADPKDENHRILDYKNVGSELLDLTDSSLAQVQHASSPVHGTSTLTPASTMIHSYHSDGSYRAPKKISRGDEPYSPGSPTSTLSNFDD